MRIKINELFAQETSLTIKETHSIIGGLLYAEGTRTTVVLPNQQTGTDMGSGGAGTTYTAYPDRPACDQDSVGDYVNPAAPVPCS